MNNNEDVVYSVGTLRVSSTKQGLQGDSHEDQKRQIENRAEQLSAVLSVKIVIKAWFKLTESASGDIDMQPVLKAIEYCLEPKNKIRYFIFKSIDRFTRGGSTVYSLLKSKLAKGGIQLVDAYGVVGFKEINTLEYLNLKYDWSVFSPTTANELAEAERSKDEVRIILTRMIGAEVNYVRLGYRVRPAPPGYKNIKVETPHGIRTILDPQDIESPWFIKMFDLRVQGNLTDQEIVNEINKMGYKSRRIKKHDPNDKTKIIGYRGERPLTVKQFQRYIQNPIYAGVNTEKWTNGQPVKAKFDGLVSIDVFNKANRGKITILETEEGLKVVKGNVPFWRMRRLKENPLYPYKQQVLCPLCRKLLLGSASRSKSGKHIPRYHCA
ncbi:MAG: recombinase family protein, partial [Bacteroidota bacterium]